ncbi:RrF2 family transcriptional regulator [Spirochaeta cellobiosiphila]|uniref:RrF2 family transcriptional regulator n=1 Tax=Spirochaeta cellobiosiphila TaxID=504483 RepID=UPI00041B0C7F|nr:Rrf2 family transcriptional regulator [Spirochaeta cellobiosiphila]
MFTISAKGLYGISAVIYLTENYQSGSVQIKDISKQKDIPQHYLEQLLVLLKRGGLVKSFRGAKGGYALAKSPSAITLLDVLEVLEGSLSLTRERTKPSQIDFVWEDLTLIIKNYLDITMDKLIDEIQKRGEQFIYTI